MLVSFEPVQGSGIDCDVVSVLRQAIQTDADRGIRICYQQLAWRRWDRGKPGQFRSEMLD
jgi:hypothetical protein